MDVMHASEKRKKGREKRDHGAGRKI